MNDVLSTEERDFLRQGLSFLVPSHGAHALGIGRMIDKLDAAVSAAHASVEEAVMALLCETLDDESGGNVATRTSNGRVFLLHPTAARCLEKHGIIEREAGTFNFVRRD